MALLELGSEETILEHRVLVQQDCEVPVIHARPEGMPRMGVVVHPDIFGNRRLFEDIAQRLASHGFAVAVVEPFARIDEADRGAAMEDPASRMGWVAELDDRVQFDDLEAAADLLVVDDDVARVGIIGFCMGGFYTLKAAAIGRFDAAVAFYGMVRLPQGPGGSTQREPLDTAAQVCPTLAIFGGVDAMTPSSDIDALRAAWSSRPDCEIVVVPDADHGFVHAPDRPAHREADAAAMWVRTIDWLTNH